MTTQEAAKRYEADHMAQYRGRGYAIYNPNNAAIETLPVIYGFNNSKSSLSPAGSVYQTYHGVNVAEDGTMLNEHYCSSEGYMMSDLGILENSNDSLHEDFKKHYPDGYRMDFVSAKDVEAHAGLSEACRLHKILAEKAKETTTNQTRG